VQERLVELVAGEYQVSGTEQSPQIIKLDDLLPYLLPDLIMMGLNPLGSHLFQLSKDVLLGIAATLCILTHIIPEVEEWHVWLFDDDGVPIHSKAGEEGDNFAYDFHQERMEENDVAAVKDSNVKISISFPLF
jgi:hypothetical protein